MKTLGKVLLLLGSLFLLIAGFQIATEESATIDPQQINSPDIVSIYWSPITAIALILAGVIALVIAKKERTIRRHY